MSKAPGIPPLHGIKDQEVFRVLHAVVQNIEILHNEIIELKKRIAVIESKL